MNVDWGIVSKVAGLGFLSVFIVVGIVSAVVWLIGLLIFKFTPNKRSENKK